MKENDRQFEIRTITLGKYRQIHLVVTMDLETYNKSLMAFKEDLANEYFDMGFVAGQDPYPTEEELADMDADRTSDDS